MNIELKQAAQQALEALQGGTGNTRSWHLAIEDAIIALRTAIQQAEAQQPATLEPPTETFVQQVPDHCDRVLWRGRYLHLPMTRPENVAAKQDTAALNWIERQHLEDLGMGLVIDAPNDGKYYVCGDSGTTHYGKTLREALASAIQQAEAQQPATGESVYWEWRHLSTHPDTVDFGKWSEWKRVEARSAIHTIEDALAEFRAYIAQGYKYELRALYDHPAPSVPDDVARDAERVPMTDTELCEALGIDGSDSWTFDVRDAVEAHHGITAQAKKEGA